MLLKTVQAIQDRLNLVMPTAIWPELKLYPFAVYNQLIYYLVNPPTLANLEMISPNIYRGATDERFLGNTAMAYADTYIAIWDEKTMGQMGIDQLTSMMVHEMFHAFQQEKKEQRFPNELLGISYPLTLENLMLRHIERDLLLQAYLAVEITIQLEHLANFMQLRHHRQQKIGEFISFEQAIESVEGTALYVEYKVLQQLKKGSIRLEDFIDGYTEISVKHLKIRLSSYDQGLLLSLIADRLLGDWQEDFMSSDLYLSDFIENALKSSLSKQEPVNIKQLLSQYSQAEVEYEYYLEAWNQQRDVVFERFDLAKAGEVIFAPVKVTGVDPMNMILRHNEVIHQNFLRFDRGQGDEVLKGPVKTEFGKHLFDVHQIEW